MENGDFPPARGEAKEDPYSVLSAMVEAVSQNHAQMRMLIYAFARAQLRKVAYHQIEEGDWLGIEVRMLALEAAIARSRGGFCAKILHRSHSIPNRH